MKLTRSMTAALVVLIAGCVKPDPIPRFTPAWEPFDPSGEGWQTTNKALLISDCQVHNLYSKALPERNLSAEAAAATAIRPPQLDMFAPDVLAWILEHGAPDTAAVLHLGDALDLACEGEFERFVDVMRGAGKPWLMAPGNHDFYYFGTYDPQDVELWKSACFEAGRIMLKDRFIRMYVAALLQQDGPGFAALADALGVSPGPDESLDDLGSKLPESFEWHARDGAPGLLVSICWNIDAERPWRSFILQAADMSGPVESEMPTRVLLLDSCQYGRRPELIPNAWQSYPLAFNCGFTGEMLPDQLRKVRAWVETEGHGYLLMCHHPFDDLAPAVRSSLGWLWSRNRIGMMVTAHTHKGFYVHHDFGREFDDLELNLASTTDWPMEWRTLQGYVNPGEGQIYVKSERHTLVDELRHREGYFLLDWEVPLGSPDDYRRYKQGEAASSLLIDFYLAHHIVPYWLPQPVVRPNAAARQTEEQVKDTMLWTYYRLISSFATDAREQQPAWPPGTTSDRAVLNKIMTAAGAHDALERKVEFLTQLERFERSRRTYDPQTGEPSDEARMRFKLSQAAWAARFEHESGRRLNVEDELIRVDWEMTLRRRSERLEGAQSSSKR